MFLMPNKKDVSLTVFFSVESSNSSLDKGECKDGNAIPRESSTKDGKLFSGGNSDERESAHEVNAQLEGSEAGFIKETDPYEGTGACPKRSKQGNSRNAETSSSKETLAGETDETEILSVQGEPENNVDLYCKIHEKTNVNYCLGLVVGSDGL